MIFKSQFSTQTPPVRSHAVVINLGLGLALSCWKRRGPWRETYVAHQKIQRIFEWNLCALKAESQCWMLSISALVHSTWWDLSLYICAEIFGKLFHSSRVLQIGEPLPIYFWESCYWPVTNEQNPNCSSSWFFLFFYLLFVALLPTFFDTCCCHQIENELILFFYYCILYGSGKMSLFQNLIWCLCSMWIKSYKIIAFCFNLHFRIKK